MSAPSRNALRTSGTGRAAGHATGLCEVYDTECIWSQAYERLKAYGEEESMLDGPVVVKDNALQRDERLGQRLPRARPPAPVRTEPGSRLRRVSGQRYRDHARACARSARCGFRPPPWPRGRYLRGGTASTCRPSGRRAPPDRARSCGGARRRAPRSNREAHVRSLPPELPRPVVEGSKATSPVSGTGDRRFDPVNQIGRNSCPGSFGRRGSRASPGGSRGAR